MNPNQKQVNQWKLNSYLNNISRKIITKKRDFVSMIKKCRPKVVKTFLYLLLSADCTVYKKNEETWSNKNKREIKSFLFRKIRNKESSTERKKYFETISATMGAANYKVYNDTKEKIEIYAIQKSYCDLFFVSGASRTMGIRETPMSRTTTHILSPGQTKEFKAGADGRGNSFW